MDVDVDVWMCKWISVQTDLVQLDYIPKHIHIPIHIHRLVWTCGKNELLNTRTKRMCVCLEMTHTRIKIHMYVLVFIWKYVCMFTHIGMADYYLCLHASNLCSFHDTSKTHAHTHIYIHSWLTSELTKV